MQFDVKNIKGYNIILIKDILESKESIDFWNLFDSVRKEDWLDPDKSNSAVSDGIIQKKNKAVFPQELDYLKEHKFLNTMSVKLFRGLYALDQEGYFAKDSVYRSACFTNWDNHLISYYENNDGYTAHKDSSLITLLFWMYKEPKQFRGGELYLPQIETTIPCDYNTGIIFPSYMLHEVKPVIMEEQSAKNSGRICYTIFCGH